MQSQNEQINRQCKTTQQYEENKDRKGLEVFTWGVHGRPL
jgi:hypothetical protein